MCFLSQSTCFPRILSVPVHFCYRCYKKKNTTFLYREYRRYCYINEIIQALLQTLQRSTFHSTNQQCKWSLTCIFKDSCKQKLNKILEYHSWMAMLEHILYIYNSVPVRQKLTPMYKEQMKCLNGSDHFNMASDHLNEAQSMYLFAARFSSHIYAVQIHTCYRDY